MASQSSHYVPYAQSQAQDVQQQYYQPQAREFQQHYHQPQVRDVQQQNDPQSRVQEVQQQHYQPYARDVPQQYYPQSRAQDVQQQFYQPQARDIQQHYHPQLYDPANNSTYAESPNPLLSPRSVAATPPQAMLSPFPQQPPSSSSRQTQSQEPYSPPPPSPSRQGLAAEQTAPIRRRPVSVSSYSTTSESNHSSGADQVSYQAAQYYPLPAPPEQPSQSHYNTPATSVSGAPEGPAQFTQQLNQYQYLPSNQPSPHPPHSQRTQSTPQLYRAPIDQRSPSPSQAISREISESQYYHPQPDQRAYSPSLSVSQTQPREIAESKHYQQPPNAFQHHYPQSDQRAYSLSPSATQIQAREISESLHYLQPPSQLAYSPSLSPPQTQSREVAESQHYRQPPNQLLYSPSPSTSQTLSPKMSESQYYHPQPNQRAYTPLPSPSALQTLSREITESQHYQQPPNQLPYSSSTSHPQLGQSSYFPSQQDPTRFDPQTYVPMSAPSQQAVPGISVTSLPTEAGLSTQADSSSLKKLLTVEKAKELLTKERAKDAYSKGKKLFNQFERIVEPIMPLLAAADPEIAVAYALRQKMKANKQQKNLAAAAEAAQQNVTTTTEAAQTIVATTPEAGQLVASGTTVTATQTTRDMPVQGAGGGGGGAGLESYGPLLAALLQASKQSEAQKSGADVGQGNNSLEALLLAVLSQQNGAQAAIPNTALGVPSAAYSNAVTAQGQLPPASAVPISTQIAIAPGVPVSAPTATTLTGPAQIMSAPIVPVQITPKSIDPAQATAAQPQIAATNEPRAETHLARQDQEVKKSSGLETFLSEFLLAAVQTSTDQTLLPSTFSPLANTSVAVDTAVTSADTATWVHHQARVFGLDDVLLPANHNVGMNGHFRLSGEVPSIEGFFQFELLYNDLQVQNKIKKISSLATDDTLTLVQGLSTKNFGISTKVGMEGVLRESEADEKGRQRLIYCAILQSPYGFGTFFSLNAPSTSLAVAKGYSASILASITWFDRKEICTDISASVNGSYRYYYSYSSGMGSFGSFRETKEYAFAANGRYEYDRECSVAASVKDNYGNTLVDASGYNPDHLRGVWEAMEYNEDAGGCKFLVLTEDNWNVKVMHFTGGGGGPLMIDGNKYHRLN